MMSIGFVYFVFLPALFTTSLTGIIVCNIGVRATMWAGLGLAAVGLPMLIQPFLPSVLLGPALVGVGTFLAQATATEFAGRVASTDPGSASGLYLASYFAVVSSTAPFSGKSLFAWIGPLVSSESACLSSSAGLVTTVERDA